MRFFVRWSDHEGQMRHPRDMGTEQVTQFLTMLTNEWRVSASTHVLKVVTGGTASPLDARPA